jgi:hypothetical protein
MSGHGFLGVQLTSCAFRPDVDQDVVNADNHLACLTIRPLDYLVCLMSYAWSLTSCLDLPLMTLNHKLPHILKEVACDASGTEQDLNQRGFKRNHLKPLVQVGYAFRS